MPLVSAAALRSLMAPTAARPLVLLDASFDLADTLAGARSYSEGHLPGAQYVQLDRDLSGPTHGADGRCQGRHPLPTRTAWAATAARLGITPGHAGVACDRQGGMYAARVWWLLRWLGHDAVAVLDGGVAAWQADGGALTTEMSLPPMAPLYPERPPLAATLDADALRAQLGRVRLIDARAPERYRGEVEPLDAAAGHIPGALNRFFKHNLDATGRFKTAEQLRSEWQPLTGGAEPTRVVHQCGSGVTACHNLLAMEAAGLPGGLLYPGSWSEWSADAARPVARG